MASHVDVKRLFKQENQHRLGLMSETGGWECHCLTRSQMCGGLHNSGTIGEWLRGIGGGLA